MRPLNYAILKHFTKIDEACVEDVMTALKPVYHSFKAFNPKDVLTSLLTAETNGLLEQTRYELDNTNALRVYFRAHPEGAATINKYIPD